MGVSVAMIVAASLASYVPTRRATRLDPIAALRDE
jgi:ABC-type lipoprotein release transport system permease subunit